MDTKIIIILTSLLCLSIAYPIQDNIPIIGLHGIFSNATLLNDFAQFIENGTGRQFINLEYGLFEKLNSLTPVYDQASHICTMLLFNKSVKNSKYVDLVGLSQGGLVMKALVQRCPFINVRYLVNIVTPNGGIYYPDNQINELINFYSEGSQKFMSYAGYYRDPTKYQQYLEMSSFLAISNNEVITEYSQANKQTMINLKNYMVAYSTNDSIVSPYGSPMYDQLDYVNKEIIYINRNETYQYINDMIGIKTLEESNRFQIISTNCSHEDHKEQACFPQLQPVIDLLNGKYDY